MPDISFGDFLNRMTGETSPEKPKKKRPQTENQRPKKKRPLHEEEEKEEEPKKKEEPKQQKKENSMPSNSSSNDDIVVKALDYSTRFLKVIYDNFKNEKDRQVVLQSIRSAIDLALGGHSVNAQNITNQNASTQQVPSNYQSNTKPEQQTQSTNENIEVRMNDLSGQQVNIDPQQYYQQQTQEGSYKKDLNLGLRVNNDGKQEVDLSNVSPHDMHEMRVLAGVDPEQKKKEEKQQGFGAGEVESIERGDNSGE